MKTIKAIFTVPTLSKNCKIFLTVMHINFYEVFGNCHFVYKTSWQVDKLFDCGNQRETNIVVWSVCVSIRLVGNSQVKI